AIDYYMPETMSSEGRSKFEAWHKEQSDNQGVFDFQQELVTYCESDVRLLKEGCLTFKRVFEAQTGFNPFDHMTIASACNRDLRMNRMIPNSLASEPVGGWRNQVNQSQVALEWLTWCDHLLRQQAQTHLTLNQSLPITRSHIQHVRNAGEFHVPGTTFTVDGLHPET
ncbi:MAG: DNA polymerase, partial [Cohaesibacter sp.]|nr:DNA polymerase [Cohaesibacter sp.]